MSQFLLNKYDKTIILGYLFVFCMIFLINKFIKLVSFNVVLNYGNICVSYCFNCIKYWFTT